MACLLCLRREAVWGLLLLVLALTHCNALNSGGAHADVPDDSSAASKGDDAGQDDVERHTAASPSYPYYFWRDFPGSEPYKQRQPKWYDELDVAVDQSFTTTNDAKIAVNWGNHRALHLWADPMYLQSFDNAIRKDFGSESHTMTGTIDSCGWPKLAPKDAPTELQYTRQETEFYDDFSKGFLGDNWLVQYDFKACCNESDILPNVDIKYDVVNGEKKAVLALGAVAEDSPQCAADPTSSACKKIVYSAGAVSTASHFASGAYEVIAKVPDAPGMIWAMWTYHYEVHLPRDCADYTCPCGNWGTQGCPDGECMPPSYFQEDACPSTNGCAFPTMCDDPGYKGSQEQTCGQDHKYDDPQFPGSASPTAYISQMNHEIDIEVPANCANTPNVCNDENGRCTGDYSTANFNNYMYTNNGGTGPGYANMCVRVTDSAGKPIQLIGDGQYHNYTIEWHTGDSSVGGATSNSYVNFFIDGIYMGTNNAFVPTRGSRLWLSLWPSPGSWNGYPNDWNGGHAGDGKTQRMETLVSSVRITPFNEPNDIMYPTCIDQPDGCDPYFTRDQCHMWKKVTISPPIENGNDDHDGHHNRVHHHPHTKPSTAKSSRSPLKLQRKRA